MNDARRTLGLGQKAKLGQCGNAVVQADFLDDLLVFQTKNRRASKVHLAARVRWKRPHQEVTEGRPGMGAATFPLADDVRSEEHTSELQSQFHLVCRLL